jgi:hypothetical protein
MSDVSYMVNPETYIIFTDISEDNTKHCHLAFPLPKKVSKIKLFFRDSSSSIRFTAKEWNIQQKMNR